MRLKRHAFLLSTSASIALAASLAAGVARADCFTPSTYYGIVAETPNPVPIVVLNYALIDAAATPPFTTRSVGIATCAVDGTTTITLGKADADGSVVSHDGDGIEMTSVGGSQTLTLVNGHVEGHSDGKNGYGITALSQSGDIGITTYIPTDVSGAADSVGVNAFSGSGSASITIYGSVSEGGVAAASDTGDALVTAWGSVLASKHDGIVATSAGGHVAVNVMPTGVVVGGGGAGIFALNTKGGDVVISNKGAITGAGAGIAVNAFDASEVTITSPGDVTGAGDAGITSSASAGATTIVTQGHVVGLGGGIHAGSASGAITIANFGGVVTSASNKFSGIEAASSSGQVVIQNDGDIGEGGIDAATDSGAIAIGSSGAVSTTLRRAIAAQSNTGAIDIHVTGGTVNAQVNEAIYAYEGASGPLTITTEAGSTVSTNDPASFAISASSFGGPLTINIGGQVGDGGVLAEGGLGAPIDVNVTGNIHSVHGVGISAVSDKGSIAVQTGAGATVVSDVDMAIVAAANAGGDINIEAGDTAFGQTYGIEALSAGGGKVTIGVDRGIAGAGGDGIHVESDGGVVGIAVSPLAAAVGVLGNGIAVKASGGPVIIEANGPVTGWVDGITVLQAGAGPITVQTTGQTTGFTGDAIATVANGGDNTVDVAAGQVQGGARGIAAVSSGGTLAVTLAPGTDVRANNPGGAGVWALNTAGPAFVNVAGAVSEGGVQATAAGVLGYANVVNAGTVKNDFGPAVVTDSPAGSKVFSFAGAAYYGDGGATGVVTMSGAGPKDINNAGTILTAQTGHAGQAVTASGTGSLSLENSGLLDGRVAASDKVTFANTGKWCTTGTSDFGTAAGAGSNSLTNTGVIQSALDGPAAATANTTFAHLGALNNGSATATGAITMVNGLAGDVLTVSGKFTGAAGHSSLALDAFLGGPGSKADELHLQGGSAGQTAILINDTNAGDGAINKAGITLVTGVTTASNFVIDPATPNYDAKFGGVDHGFYLYELSTKGGVAQLSSRPGVHAAHGPSLLSAVLQVWSSTGLDHVALTPAGDRLALAADGAEPPRVWMTASNWTPNRLNAGRTDLWASPLGSPAGDPTGLASVSRTYDSPSADGPSLAMNAGYSQSTGSLVGGVDLMRRRTGDSALVVGLVTGYVQSDQAFDLGDDAVRYDGSVFGFYSSYQTGPWRVDGQLKANVLKVRYLGRGANANADATASVFGGDVSVRYRQKISARWTLEPQAMLSLAQAQVGDLHAYGAGMAFSGGRSARAGLGLNLSGDYGTRAWRIDLSASARVWNEFAGDNAMSVAGQDLSVVDHLGGRSTEVGARLDLGRRDGGVSAFLDAGYRSRPGLNAATVATGLAWRW